MAKNNKHRAHKKDSKPATRVGIGRDARHAIRKQDQAHAIAIIEDAKRSK